MYSSMRYMLFLALLYYIPKHGILLVNSEYNKMVLERDYLYNGQKLLYNRYIIKSTDEVDIGRCAHSCLSNSHECLALLYNKSLQTCRLLRCHLTEKLFNSSTSSGEWEYWKNFAVCDEGWLPFAGHCYYHRTTRETWAAAKNFCEGFNSNLIEFESHEETAWVSDSFLLPVRGVEDRCPKFYDCGIWIGATNHANPGTFVWTHSGSDMLFPEWSINQPNNVGGDQNCVILMRYGTGNDVSCLNRNEFVCEKEYNHN